MLYDLWWWLTATWLGRATAILTTVGVIAGAGALWWRTAAPQRFDTLTLGEPAAPRPAAIVAGRSPIVPLVHPSPAAVVPRPTPVAARPTVWLVFSSGTPHMAADEAEWLRMNDAEGRAGEQLSDVIMLVVRGADGTTALLSIPRDTWVYDRGYRINAVYARDGLQAFVDEVTALTGLPVDHVAAVNMRGFARLVDAAGGVVVATDRPLRDDYSHLPALAAGCWRLDGPDALAYVRSRHTLTLVGGRWRSDRSASDFGRIERQREVIRSLWDGLRGPNLIPAVPTLVSVAGDDLTLDDTVGIGDLVELARSAKQLAGGSVETFTLPTRGETIRGAAAQVVVESEARPVLGRLATLGTEPAETATPDPGVPSPDPIGRAAPTDTPTQTPTDAPVGAPTDGPTSAVCADPQPTPWRR